MSHPAGRVHFDGGGGGDSSSGVHNLGFDSESQRITEVTTDSDPPQDNVDRSPTDDPRHGGQRPSPDFDVICVEGNINAADERSGEGRWEEAGRRVPSLRKKLISQMERRIQHKMQKLKASLIQEKTDPDLERLRNFRPLDVTFLDKTTGVEYDAYGAPLPLPMDQYMVANSNTGAPHFSAPGGHCPPNDLYIYQTQTWQGVVTTGHVLTDQPMTNGNIVVSPDVPDYMCMSVFATLCCCFLLGLIAIMYSNTAKQMVLQQQYESARAKSSAAKNCIIASVVVGLLAYVAIAASTVLRSL